MYGLHGMPLVLRLVTVCACLILTAGCGGGVNQLELERGLSGFSVTPLVDPALDGLAAQGYRLELAPGAVAGALLAVEVHTAGGADVRAAYFQVRYDAARYTWLRCEAGPLLRDYTPAGQVLELSALREPGLVECGQVLPNYDTHRGACGGGMVARLLFSRQAQGACPRQANTPPNSAGSACKLELGSAALLSWRNYNTGDYNQDGQVLLTDLTALARFFGQSVEYPADEDTAKAVADGNHDGSIGYGDLPLIGMNWGKCASRWNVYRSLDQADYPFGAGDDNGAATLAGSLPHGAYDSSTLPNRDRLLYTLELAPAAVAGEHFWVRPADPAAIEGTPSNLATYSAGS